jgi:hypothetical protein
VDVLKNQGAAYKWRRIQSPLLYEDIEARAVSIDHHSLFVNTMQRRNDNEKMGQV